MLIASGYCSSRRRSVAILSLTEIWERFSYAGMRAILVLYLSQWLLVGGRDKTVWGLAGFRNALEGLFGPLGTAALALQIYGIYDGLFYFTPLPGGFLADRVLGARRAILLGGALMAAAQFCLTQDRLFLIGLALMIAGGGLFKPTISAQLGALFDRHDRRRDRAFAIFYVCINIGTFLAPLICGTIGERIGWHYGFLASAVGMLFGLAIFAIGWRDRLAEALPVDSGIATKPAGTGTSLVPLLVVAALVPLFWVAYTQKSGAVILWAKAAVDLDLGRLGTMPTSWILALNPLFVFLFTPLLQALWARIGTREPGATAKLAIGFLMLSAAFLLLSLAAAIWGGAHTVPLWCVASFVALLTLGELFLSPIGLSLFSRLAPVGYSSLTLALWFLASFAGNYGSGLIASIAVKMNRPIYFALIAALPLAGGILMLMARLTVLRHIDLAQAEADAKE